jgi:hypothetical protein
MIGENSSEDYLYETVQKSRLSALKYHVTQMNLERDTGAI